MPDITVQDLIRQEAAKAGVPASLALAVAEQESGFNPTVTGPKLPSGEQAIGTFQILPSTAKSRGFDPTDPVQNIRGGVGYLRELLDQHQGDVSAVLKDYGGVVHDTEYVPNVLKRLPKFKDEPPPKTTETAPPPVTPPAGASLGLAKRFLETWKGQAADVASVPADLLTGAAKGFAAGPAGRFVGRMGEMLRQRFPSLAGGPEVAITPPSNTAQKVGAALEPAAEFLLPAAAITKTAKALPIVSTLVRAGVPAARAAMVAAGVEGVAQGAAGYGIAKGQGASTTGAAVSGGLSAIGPVVSKAIELGAPAIRTAAETKLARIFAKGLEDKGPLIDEALKTGNAAPQAQHSVDIVRQAAKDTLDLPIQASWGKWMTTLGKDLSAKGQSLESALKSGLGQQAIPKQPILDALDDLANTSAQHFAQISQGGFTQVPYNKPLLKEIQVLKEALGQYDTHITVQNLVDLKRTWDSAVYNLSTAGKVGVSPEVLVSNAMKEAAKRGADTIRSVFDQQTPTIAALDEAVSHAYRLKDLTAKLYKVNPAMSRGAHTLSWALGAGLGSQILGWHGALLGGATGRMLASAMESPLWQTLTPLAKGKLATALANGQGDTVRQIITPLLASAASQTTTAAQPASTR